MSSIGLRCRDDLAERGLLDRPELVVAALRWSDAGKIDYALGGRSRSSASARMLTNTALVARRDDYAGADVLIVTRASFEKIVGQFWFLFDTIEPIAPATVLHAGRPALRLNLVPRTSAAQIGRGMLRLLGRPGG